MLLCSSFHGLAVVRVERPTNHFIFKFVRLFLKLLTILSFQLASSFLKFIQFFLILFISKTSLAIVSQQK